MDRFIDELSYLRHYIKGLELERQLLSLEIKNSAFTSAENMLLQYQQHSSIFITHKKRLDYSCIIITLYSLFEQFIESLLKSYVKNLNNIVPKYKDMPDSIIKHHLGLSCDLMNRLDQSPYQGIVTIEQIIGNLHSCLGDTNEFRINTAAFTQHTANLRSVTLQTMFTCVGIHNLLKVTLENSNFVDYLKHEHPGIDLKHFRENEQFRARVLFYLDDLVTRRNEVAHRIPDNILQNDLLLNYISFFEFYSRALYEISYNQILPYLVEHHGIKLGNPFKVLKQGAVAGLEIKNTIVRLSDCIIAKPANVNSPYLMSKVERLEVNHQERQQVEPGEKTGIQISFKAKENQTFFLIPEFDKLPT